jgi:hypothetical protein
MARTPASDEAQVIALFGDWGCGKSTIKHFTAYFLEKEHSIRPIEFSPWEWSGRDKLMDAFFVQVGTALRRGKWPWQDFAFAQTFRRYAATFGLFAPLVAWGKTWWLPLLMFLSGGASLLTRDLWAANQIGLWLLAAVVGGAGALLVLLQLVTEGLAGYAAKWAELRRDSLEAVRADLRAVLKQQPKPVVIFIDDLDRLEPQEIRQVTALIKATVNLPGLVFLILCQRHTVARALDGIAGGPGTGEQFLDKIVQVSFHVPEPPSGRLAEMLKHGLKDMLNEPKLGNHWEWERWQELYDEHLSGFFRTPRQVARYLASLPFGLHQHLHAESLEINPVDVAALEVLRLMEPAVFERIASRPIVFEANSFFTLPGSNSDEETPEEKTLNWVVAVATEARRDEVRKLLMKLVPQFNRGRSISEATRDDWDRTKRVCHSNHYDRYFQLVLPDGYVTTSEFDHLKEAATKGRNAVYEALCVLEDRGALRHVVSRSHVFLHGLTNGACENVFYALCIIGDRLPELRGYSEDDWFKLSAQGVARNLLMAVGPDLRATWIEGALKSKAGLDFAVGFVQGLNRKMEDGSVDLSVEPAAEANLRKYALDRIHLAAADGGLWRSSWLGWHLGFWAKHEGVATVQKWMKQEVKSSTTAIHLVKSLVAVSTSAENYYPRLHAAQLDQYLPLEALLDLLPLPLPEKPRERDAVILLGKAAKLKSAGTPLGDVKLNDRDP